MSLMDEKDNASLERGAADDIVRMRWRLKIRENIIARLVLENVRLRNGAPASCETACPHVRGTVTQYCALNFTLSDEERGALQEMCDFADALLRKEDTTIFTLRNLLARLS